ncbi:MAG: hypothetical protein ACRDWA_15575 [Acidimicrobiia bacterium]
MILRCRDQELASLLGGEGVGLVFFADPDVSDRWEDVLTELAEAFSLTKAAASQGEPIVYVVAGDDLLGRDGIGAAMVATALLSGARTASLELKKSTVNTLAVEKGSSPESIATWVRHLLTVDGPRGELVRLGGAHLGKALP